MGLWIAESNGILDAFVARLVAIGWQYCRYLSERHFLICD